MVDWACFLGRANSPAGWTDDTIDSRAAARQPTRRPARSGPLWVYTPPGYDDGDHPVPGRLRHPGVHRPRGDVGEPDAVPAAVPRDRRRRLRPRRGARLHRGLRRRVDGLRRVAVRRLARHRPVPLVPVRRGGAVGRRAVPDDRRPRPRGDLRQVVRRVRRDDHADAAAGPVRRARHPRRRLRCTSSATSPSSARRSATCARTTATSCAGGTTSGPARRSPRTPTSACSALLGCAACFSARPDGTPELPFDPRTGALRPEVWQRWLDWDPVRMVDRYADALRSLRLDLDRRRHEGRVLPRPGCGGVPGRA